MVYKNINEVTISRKELERINKFFEICFDDIDENGDYVQQDLIDELCAFKDDRIFLFAFKFENGAVISIELASGSSNYYDSNWLILSDDDDYWFDCGYDIDEVMEFEYDEDVYICKLTIVEE